MLSIYYSRECIRICLGDGSYEVNIFDLKETFERNLFRYLNFRVGLTQSRMKARKMTVWLLNLSLNRLLK